MRSLASVILIIAALAGVAEAKKLPYPSKASLLTKLFAAAGQRLDPNKHPGCDPGSIGGATVGEYLALLITSGSEGDVHRLDIACEAQPQRPMPVEPGSKLARRYWFCRVEAPPSDAAGESPWNYSLQFLIDRQTGKLNRQLFACPGTP